MSSQTLEARGCEDCEEEQRKETVKLRMYILYTVLRGWQIIMCVRVVRS